MRNIVYITLHSMSPAPADSTGRRLSRLAGTIVKNTIVYGNSKIKLRNCMFDFDFMNNEGA